MIVLEIAKVAILTLIGFAIVMQFNNITSELSRIRNILDIWLDYEQKKDR